MSPTHYQTLEVEPACDADEIRKAYRLLAKQLHPDLLSERLKKAGAEEFVKIQLAYEELSDPGRRADYDKKLAKEARREEEARAAAAQPAPKPSAKPKPDAKPDEPKPEPAAEAEDKPEKMLGWDTGLSAALLVGGAVAGGILAWLQISEAESGWARVFPISWIIITFLLMILALFEDGVLHSMFLAMAAIAVLTGLFGGASWIMLGIQIACTGAIVGAIKLLVMFVADRMDERSAMRA